MSAGGNLKNKLSLREAAVLRTCWLINNEEKKLLDKFFLIKDTWENVDRDITIDDVELKRFLIHDGTEYEVILCSPVRILRASAEIGLSFRVNISSGLKIILIKEWKATTAEAANGEAVPNA